MKKYISLLCISLMLAMTMGSCASFNHGDGHGAMKPVGKKSHRDSQVRLSSAFGGKNYHRPNKFKKKHF